ncbi:hypothetical protein AX17_007514 [Amanita inopinata Kibby_2008]|nr:hypothetical protein AX17_007514 [Amanita inopinata Kibby_2008]
MRRSPPQPPHLSQLDIMHQVPQKQLDKVENEEGESNALVVGRDKVGVPDFVGGLEAEGNAGEDDGAGDEELDEPVGVEPSAVRIGGKGLSAFGFTSRSCIVYCV